MTNPTREETPMSENMFQDFASPERVLDEYVMAMNRLGTISESLQARADALARIAELSPRTVDEAGRERAREALIRGVRERDSMDWPDDVLDRIIDALGWTATEPEADPDADLKLKPGEVAQDWSKLLRRGVVATPAPVPPAPVVELDADELEGAAAIVRAHNDCAVDFPPITFSLYTNGAPPLLTIGSNRDGVSVLRIGGDQ